MQKSKMMVLSAKKNYGDGKYKKMDLDKTHL